MVHKLALTSRFHPPTPPDPSSTLNLQITYTAIPQRPSFPSSPPPPSPPSPPPPPPAPKSKYPAKSHCRLVSRRLVSSTQDIRNSHTARPLPTQHLIYLPSQPPTLLPNSDQPTPYRQSRYFSYLTGLTSSPTIATSLSPAHMTYDISTDTLTLYLPRATTKSALWTGPAPSHEDILAEYDVDYIKDTEHSLASDLCAWSKKASGFGLIYILNPESCPPCFLPNDTLFDCHGTLQLSIDACRVYKDEFEVNLLRKAIAITGAAHKAVYEALLTIPTAASKPNVGCPPPPQTESDLEAVYTYACLRANSKLQAYDPILASGRNASILHYTRNNAPLPAPGGVLLIDAAVEHACYAADITRTWPISPATGFSPRAKEIYDIVTRMQVAGIASSVPGTLWGETHVAAARVAVEGLLDLGILKGASVEDLLRLGTVRAFFPHGLGHFVGLEVHDVESVDTPGKTASLDQFGRLAEYRNLFTGLPSHGTVGATGGMGPRDAGGIHPLIARTLEKDMVLTVEPGIYFSRAIVESLLNDQKGHARFVDLQVLEGYWEVGGVRIEDMVLVKEGGNEVLSDGVGRWGVGV